MDRQSLLAFLLIGIIIVFYPWYMNLVSPVEVGVSEEYVVEQKPEPLSLESPAPQIFEEYKVEKSSPVETIDIKTNLYNLEISNKNGGSLVSYSLYKFNDHLGKPVNLIDDINIDNLLLGFVSVDGDKTSLNHNWSSSNKRGFLSVDRGQKTLMFTTVHQGQSIKKIFTFYSDSYNIDIDVVFENPSKFISRDQYTFRWSGGLPPTEKNITNDFQFFEGFASLGGEHMGSKPKKGKVSEESQKGSTLWTAIKTKYFLSAIVPSEPGIAAKIESELVDKRPIYNTEITQRASSENNFTVYLGPLDYSNLKDFGVGLESNVDLGWALFRPIGQLISWLLSKMYAIIPNYGIVVILFAFLIKLLLNPLTVKTFESTRKMQSLAPEINKIKEKYKNDPQKMSRAQMELYKSSGANPMGGCLPMLIQMPILVSVFSIFRSKIEFRGAPFFSWINDLSVPDTLFEIGGFPINILPVLMGSTMFIQQQMMAAPNADANQKTMMYVMNVFFLFLFYSFPSGLNLYYFVFNLLSIIQQKYLIPKPAEVAMGVSIKKMMNGDATFVAPATPFGHSGIAVVRINGPLACQILSILSKQKLADTRYAKLTSLYDDNGQLIDECVVTKFQSPASYTGDDLIEVSCHGNPVIVDKIIKTIIDNGARLAEPGEFTKRAFINGKIDLLQAEAVGALIKSKSEAAARINRQTLGGALSKDLNNINLDLISVVGKIEHAIDIIESEIEITFYRERILEIDKIIKNSQRILSTFKAGKMLNEGIRVVITGKPNVGKSTLINYLSGSEKAIVSNIPGTTRDIVESMITISGVPVRFVDTAGIHVTDDKIEKIGINKANYEINSADLVLYIYDDPKQLEFPKFDCPSIYIFNKIDLHKNIEDTDSIIHISAKSGLNVDFLLKKIKKTMSINPISTDTPHLISQHQYSAINKSLKSQEKAKQLLKFTSPELELVAFELRASINAIDVVLGKTSPDDILNNIFRTLCVGK